MDFKSGYILTNKGKALHANIEANKGTLKLTKMVLGAGQVDSLDEYADATDLVNVRHRMLIESATVDGAVCIATASVSSDAVEEGFYATELGLFAMDGDNEILYAVSYDENPSYVPGKADGAAVECEFKMYISFSAATNVTITLPKEEADIVALVGNNTVKTVEASGKAEKAAADATAAADRAETSAASVAVDDAAIKAVLDQVTAKETNVTTLEANAKTAADNAKTSETNAKASETASAESAKAADTSAQNAEKSSNSAGTFASQARDSAKAAQTSAGNASTSENNATRSAASAQKVLDTIASGQVQADWNVTDTTSKAYIKNKPDLTNISKGTFESLTVSGETSVPTPNVGNKSKTIANTEFVQNAVAGIVDSAPDTLNTLKELASALGNDANFSTTVTNLIGEKESKTDANVEYEALRQSIATKQDKLTFDETPTAGSTNPVTSNGIKAAIDNASGLSEEAVEEHWDAWFGGNLQIPLKVEIDTTTNHGYAAWWSTEKSFEEWVGHKMATNIVLKGSINSKTNKPEITVSFDFTNECPYSPTGIKLTDYAGNSVVNGTYTPEDVDDWPVVTITRTDASDIYEWMENNVGAEYVFHAKFTFN